jgi:hypothetical protein
MKVAQKQTVALATAIVCVLASASTAQAIIQVQRGISGVRLNMSPSRVKAGLGTPAKVKHGSNDFGPFTQFIYAGGITVTFQGNTNVTGISTNRGTDRTPSGVGVGSTEQAVKKGVRGVKCETILGERDCHVGPFLAGNRVTDFLFRNGRVRRVTVAFVID